MRAKMNLSVLNVEFDTDSECREALEDLRWPDGVRCLRCDSDKISRISTRRQYDCDSCRYRFSVTTGTIFHDSHLPLQKWFLAVLLICEAKKSMSAHQLKRTLGVAYKTAWYLNHRIREAMAVANPDPLVGKVEVDETYIGGKRRGVGRGRIVRKRMILGAVQRDGMLRMDHGPHDDKQTIQGFVRATVSDDATHIYTDGHPSYRGIGDHNTKHEWVDHSKKEYVRGDVTTNQIEGAFGLFKRALVGSFHQVSVKHLDRYLDEFQFRYNNRRNPYLFRDTLTRLVTNKTLTYDVLTAASIS